MIQNYLKIAWRNLLRHKSFSLINILGLSAGIAACIVIFLYVQYELTYDRHNSKADRIARVVSSLHAPGSADMEFGTAPYLMADALKRDFPEIASAARLEPKPTIVRHNGELINETGFYQADQHVFSIFDYTFLEGTVTGALQQPHSVVLTASTARKYFGEEPAVGKTIICDDQPKTVTGVIANPPGNSDIQFTALLYTDYSKKTIWLDDFPAYTFILFNNRPDLKGFERKMKRVADKYCQPELDKADAAGYSVSFALESLSDVHFSKGKMVDTPKGNKQFNYVFSLLAVFILVIALLNYINLSTARATERAREVGVRKVNGARPFQLIRQFLFESLLLITIAWLIAFVIVLIVLPYFNTLLTVQLRLSWQGSALFLLCIFVVTILLAGLYPAFVLSRFRPVEILKGKWRYSSKGILLRRVLTTAQFVITAALITGTIVIYHQVKYIENKDTGYLKDQVATIHLENDSLSQRSAPSFINTLKEIPAIKGISAGSGLRSEALSMGTTFAGDKRREMMCNYYFIDKELLPLLQIRLKEGRNVSDSLSTDKTEAFLVNEAFVEKMGWTSALGQPMDGYFHKGKVVGVVKNFYYKSLHNAIEPLVMVYNTNPIRAVIIKIQPKDLPLVAAAWKKHFTAKPFSYTFMDEAYKAQYDKDRLTMRLFTWFTVLAILISCLGLYGLVSLMAVQRTKEIGIRKVLGASVQQLVSLLTRDFVKLIILASLIALPAAGIAMTQWLSSYAYHISLAWWMFLLPVVLIILIALAVIGQQVVKAALTNPVHALRNE